MSPSLPKQRRRASLSRSALNGYKFYKSKLNIDITDPKVDASKSLYFDVTTKGPDKLGSFITYSKFEASEVPPALSKIYVVQYLEVVTIIEMENGEASADRKYVLEWFRIGENKFSESDSHWVTDLRPGGDVKKISLYISGKVGLGVYDDQLMEVGVNHRYLAEFVKKKPDLKKIDWKGDTQEVNIAFEVEKDGSWLAKDSSNGTDATGKNNVVNK